MVKLSWEPRKIQESAPFTLRMELQLQKTLAQPLLKQQKRSIIFTFNWQKKEKSQV